MHSPSVQWVPPKLAQLQENSWGSRLEGSTFLSPPSHMLVSLTFWLIKLLPESQLVYSTLPSPWSVPRHFSTDMLESALGDWLWFTSPGIPCYLFPDGTLGYWWLSHSFGMQCLSHLAACSMVGPLRLREPCVAEQMTIPVPLPNIWQSWAPRNIQS